MYGCVSLTIKMAEHWRIDAFELWCWRRLLRDPWTPGRSNQSILKEINPEYSLEELMVILKFQYFGQLMRRTDSLERLWCWARWRQEEMGMTEDEMAGWHHQLSGHEFEQAPGAAVHGAAKNQTWLSDWTTTRCVGGGEGDWVHPGLTLLWAPS